MSLDDDMPPMQPAEQWAIAEAAAVVDTAAARLAGEATAAYWLGMVDAMRGRPKSDRIRRGELLELVDTFLYRYLDDHAPGGADE